MSRQGNYVSGANGSVDWTSGVRDSLGALSRSLLDQGRYKDQKENDNEIRKNALLRDDKIRQENLQREKDIRKDDISWRESQAKEDTRRYENSEERIKTEFEQKQDRKQALSDYNMFVLNHDPETKFERSAYTGNIGQIFDNRKSMLDEEKTATAGFLKSNKEGDDIESLNTALEAYENQLSTSGLDPVDIKNKKEIRRNNLLSLRDQLKANPDVASDTIETQLSRIYSPQYEKLNKAIEDGQGLTAREEAEYIMRSLPDNVRKNLDPAEIRMGLAPILRSDSRAALQSSEEARVDEINEAKKLNIKNAVSFANKMYGKSSSGSFRGDAGAVKALNLLTSVSDIGPFDKKDLTKGFNHLVNVEKIEPELAAAVVANGISRGFFGDSFPDMDTEEFKEMVFNAKQMQGVVKNTSEGNRVDFTMIPEYVPERANSVDSLLAKQTRLGDITTNTFQVDDNFNRKKIQDFKNTTAQYMLAAAEDSKFGNTDAGLSPRELYDNSRNEIEVLREQLSDTKENSFKNHVLEIKLRRKENERRLNSGSYDDNIDKIKDLDKEIAQKQKTADEMESGFRKDHAIREIGHLQQRRSLL